MIRFLSLEVADFRGIKSAAVKFTSGLNVLYGDNELGKSSLLTALRAVLFLPVGSSEANDYQTWGSDRIPTVTLSFEIEGTAYRVHKQFASGSRGNAALDRLKGSERFSIVNGRAVDAELRKLIAWGMPEPGRNAPRGLPESYLSSALLGFQEDVESVLSATIDDDRTESGKQALTEALGALGQDALVTTILDQLEASTSKVFTPTGQLKRTQDSPLSIKTRDLQLCESRLRALQEDLLKTEDVEGSRSQLKERAEAVRHTEIEAKKLVDLANNAVAAEKQLSDLQDKEAKLNGARAAYTLAEDNNRELNKLAKTAQRAGEIHQLLNQGVERQTELDQAIQKQLDAKQKLDQIQSARLEIEQHSKNDQQQLDSSQQQLATLQGRHQTLVDSAASLSQSKQRELQSNIAAATQRITQAENVGIVLTETNAQEEKLNVLRSQLADKKADLANAEHNLKCAQAADLVETGSRLDIAHASLIAEIQTIEESIDNLNRELAGVADGTRPGQAPAGVGANIESNEDSIRAELNTIQSLKVTWQNRLNLALAEDNSSQSAGINRDQSEEVLQQRFALEQDIAQWQDDIYSIESRFKRQQESSSKNNIGPIAVFAFSLVMAVVFIALWFLERFPLGIVTGPLTLLLGLASAHFMRPKTRHRSGGANDIESRISAIENDIHHARTRLSTLDSQFEGGEIEGAQSSGNTQGGGSHVSARVSEAQDWLDNLNDTEAELYTALQQRTGTAVEAELPPQSNSHQHHIHQQIQELQPKLLERKAELQALVPVDSEALASSQAFLIAQGYADDFQQEVPSVAAANEQFVLATRTVEAGEQELANAQSALTFSKKRCEELASQLGGDAIAIITQEQQIVRDATSALALVDEQHGREIIQLNKDIESQQSSVNSARVKLQESQDQLTDQSAAYTDVQSNLSNWQARVEQLQSPVTGDVKALEEEFTGIKSVLQAIPRTTVDFSSLTSIESLSDELSNDVKKSEVALNRLRGELAVADAGITKLSDSESAANAQSQSPVTAAATDKVSGSTEQQEKEGEAQDVLRQAARDTIQRAISESNGLLNNDQPFTAQLNALQITLKEKVRAAKKIERELQMSRGRLDMIGGSVLREQIGREQESKSRIQHEAQEFEARCEAEKYLLDVISDCSHTHTAHLGRMLAEPVSQTFNELTGNRYGQFTLEPTLTAEAVVVDGSQREYEQLSVGTRHQLAVLVRLSIAAYLKASLVLDDQLVQSDPKRLAWFRDTLHNSTRDRDHQIIVITCRPGDYGVPFDNTDVNSSVGLQTVIQR